MFRGVDTLSCCFFGFGGREGGGARELARLGDSAPCRLAAGFSGDKSSEHGEHIEHMAPHRLPRLPLF